MMALLIDERPFFSMLLLDRRRTASYSGQMCYLRQASFVLFANSQFKLNRQWPMRVAVNSRSSWIPTAPASRYYTDIQSFNGCCGSLLSCQAIRRACYWVCVVVFRKIANPLDTLTRLIFAIDDLFDRTYSSLRSLGSLVLFVVWSGQSIQPAPYTLVLSFLFSVALLLSLRLWAKQLASACRDRSRLASFTD